MKFFLQTPKPEISECIQKILFKKGYSWCVPGDTPRYTDEGVIIWDDQSKYLSWGGHKWRNENNYTEVTLDQLQPPSIREAIVLVWQKAESYFKHSCFHDMKFDDKELERACRIVSQAIQHCKLPGDTP